METKAIRIGKKEAELIELLSLAQGTGKIGTVKHIISGFIAAKNAGLI
jgi:hypothetical protein